MKVKIQSLEMCKKNGRFCTSTISKIDFTQNLDILNVQNLLFYHI